MVTGTEFFLLDHTIYTTGITLFVVFHNFRYAREYYYHF